MRRVLVIDDDADQRRVMRSLLNKAGAEVFEAENGQDGVSHAATTTPDLIFIDIDMPKMDGFDCARLLRAAEVSRRHTSTIVGVTAHVGEVFRSRARDAGMNAIIQKPLRSSLLTAIVRGESELLTTSTPTPASINAELADFAPRYLANKRRALEDAQRHLAEGELEEVARVGHQIRGTAEAMGLAELSAQGARLEAAAIAGDVAGATFTIDIMLRHIDTIAVPAD